MNHRKNYTELKHLLDTYHLRQVCPWCFGVNQQSASNILKTMSNFADDYTIKSPDIYAKCNKNIIGIEHFEYDSSRKTKRGSTERLGIERANREFLELAYEAAARGQDLSRDCEIKTNSGVDTLKGNFLDNFRKHKRQIDAYRSNLKDVLGADNTPMWFLAEDVSVMSPNFFSYLIIDGYPRFPLLPIFYKDVQEEILQSSIDGMIFVSSFPISHFVVFIANNSLSFDQMVKHYHFNEDSLIDFPDNLSYGFSSFCIP